MLGWSAVLCLRLPPAALPTATLRCRSSCAPRGPTCRSSRHPRSSIRDQLDSVFVSTSSPHDVRVSRPLHDPRGLGWTAWVKAEVNSATGRLIGTETYCTTISEGQIVDRRRADGDDNCISDTYQPS